MFEGNAHGHAAWEIIYSRSAGGQGAHRTRRLGEAAPGGEVATMYRPCIIELDGPTMSSPYPRISQLVLIATAHGRFVELPRSPGRKHLFAPPALLISGRGPHVQRSLSLDTNPGAHEKKHTILPRDRRARVARARRAGRGWERSSTEFYTLVRPTCVQACGRLREARCRMWVERGRRPGTVCMKVGPHFVDPSGTSTRRASSLRPRVAYIKSEITPALLFRAQQSHKPLFVA